MSTTHARSVTAAVGAAIVGVAAPALLFLGAANAHAMQDISERGAVAIVDNLPTPRDCGMCFNPQPDPPGYPDPSSETGVGNPNDAAVGGPEESRLGDPSDSIDRSSP